MLSDASPHQLLERSVSEYKDLTWQEQECQHFGLSAMHSSKLRVKLHARTRDHNEHP
jgi:hypothetical protein